MDQDYLRTETAIGSRTLMSISSDFLFTVKQLHLPQVILHIFQFGLDTFSSFFFHIWLDSRSV